MGKTFRIAVIGAGAMGREHVDGWQRAGHRVVSITDLNPDAARSIAAQFGVPAVFADYREAISSPEADIVSICLPLTFHAPVTIFAARQGKHVFCEKPLARSMEEAAEMEEAVRAAGVRFGIGFQRNVAGDVEVCRQYVQSGQFGRPLVLNSDVLAMVRPKLAMHDKHDNNGPIVDACCHSFLMWQTILQANPKNVYARGAILAKGRPEVAHLEQAGRLAIDTAVVVVEFESGDIGAMTVSWGLAKDTKLFRRPDRIVGPRGGAELSGAGSLRICVGDREESIVLGEEHLHRKQFERFAHALTEGGPVPAGFPQGKQMLALSLAALTSVETGEVVPVPDAFREHGRPI